ncbi:MAG: hypothetical protein F4Z66_05790 [Gammaproteobacteria bacterium]|nr:hypothetical protein [Gammaproteobacteria bacterium]
MLYTYYKGITFVSGDKWHKKFVNEVPFFEGVLENFVFVDLTTKTTIQALEGLERYLEGRQLTDGELAAYVTHLYDKGKSPSTITIVVAAVKWRLKNPTKLSVYL